MPVDLNELERIKVGSEDVAEDAYWSQAEEVARRNDAGETLDAIAAPWINLRSGRPYARTTVGTYAWIWRRFGAHRPRPVWTEAWRASGHGGRNQRPRTRRTVPGDAATILNWSVKTLHGEIARGDVPRLWALEEAYQELGELLEDARGVVFGDLKEAA